MKQKVTFETYGCSANHADTATMQHHAIEAGYEVTDDSDTVIINTCAVKGPTQTAFEKRIQTLKENGKKVIITGCLAQSMPNHPLIKKEIALGPDHLDSIPEALVSLQNKKTFRALSIKKKPAAPAGVPIDPAKPFVVPISQGCLSSCSFCMTKFARGNLRSFEPRIIREQIQGAVERGVSEIFLTSQDTSAYGVDINLTFTDLLEQLLKIDGDFRIRIGMANPQHFSKFQKSLWPLFQSPKLYRFLHIPVQSGSDAVLDEMRREHTKDDFLHLVQEARSHYPDMTIATDIISSYPTETESCHQQTLSVLRESLPDAVNISRFWPRPNTRAAKLSPLKGDIAKRRSKEITSLFHQIARIRNRSWLDWSGEVRQSELSRRDQVLGRNQSYKQVILEGLSKEDFVAGKKSHVTISDYGKFELRARAEK